MINFRFVIASVKLLIANLLPEVTMYNTDPDKLPKKPVTISQTSANKEFARWLEQNNRHSLCDASGLNWNIHLETLETPDPADHRQVQWSLTLRITSEVNAAQLLAGQTLHENNDERLLSLFGDASIRIALKPITHQEATLDGARKWLAAELNRLREQFAKDGFHEVKRQLVGRWIDEERLFG